MDTNIYVAENDKVQDWNDVCGTFVQNVESGQRKRVSRQQQIRLQKRKKRIARRRRRKRILGIILLCIGAYLALKFVGNIIGGAFGDLAAGWGRKTTVIPKSKYTSNTPQVLDEGQVQEQLKKLADTYPEFEEVYENMEAYPEKLLSALCNNPEMIEFVKGYPGQEETGKGWFTKSELAQQFPLLLQWDKRWGYIPYGDNIIGLSGCAPTCLSMVIVGLTGDKSATPDAIANYATDNGYYVEGIGTAWSLMNGIHGYGVIGQETTLDEGNIYQELEDGHPIICSMRPGDFTSTGHFIVLTGIEDGKIRVNDPNSLTRSRQLWDYDALEYQISNLWFFMRE